MKRIASLAVAAGLFALSASPVLHALGQPPAVSPSGIPYPPRQSTPPAAPPAVSRPGTWVGGPETVINGNAPRRAPAEVAVQPWRKQPLPEKFDGTEVVARVGTEVILASDVLPAVEEPIRKAIASGQVPASQETALRYHLMQQRLAHLIDTKMLYIEARREIPKENMDKIRKKVKEIYEQEHLPKLIDGKRIKSRAELIKAMRDAGTSIEEQERQFFEQSLAAHFVNNQVDEDEEITHAEMLEYYRAHLKDYETPPRVRWEHIMARFSNYRTKEEAYAKIAQWGNEVLRGAPLSEVAKRHSDDLSSEEGGQHDWTHQGSLASEVLDRAIFSLPAGQLSPILEDDRGFHIIRVVERQELARKPFGEVQAEIKKRIQSNREGTARNAYLADLRKQIPVWTIFDDLNAQAKKQEDSTRR